MTEPISRLEKNKSGIGRGARGVSPSPAAPLDKAEEKKLSQTYTPHSQKEETKKEPGSSGNVAVYARFRPLNEKEKAMGEA